MDVRLRQKALISGVLFIGLGHILFLKQQVKGALYFLVGLITFYFVAIENTGSGFRLNFNGFIVQKIRGFITLGVFNPNLPVRERDHSIFMMVDGLLCVLIIVLFLIVYVISIRDILKIVRHYEVSGGELADNRSFLKHVLNRAFPSIGLSPVIILLLFFVVLPIIFSFCIAFTNYSYPNNIPPANKVDWVFFQNFRDLFGGAQAMWTSALWRVLTWTLIWAILSTACVYLTGMFMAISLSHRNIKIASFFRSIFILPYAVPAVLSMMVWANLLNGTFGPINAMLMQSGLISQNIPWLTDIGFARFSMVVVTTWCGFPYHMLMVTSIMTSISPDLYEAASIDGASKRQQTFKITIPLVLSQTVPLIIMAFTFNINNFGAAYFLFMGAGSTRGPSAADTVSTNANGIDIVVTWIYKLTMQNPQKFQYASVLAVLLFAVLTPFAIWNYTRTKSYKESGL
ncbi:MAG: sugar ABC transporter permease [Lachnospiraceae bacterium]|nr:sugar ABC transporter permease [Lachnospiraceae bacterium]